MLLPSKCVRSKLSLLTLLLALVCQGCGRSSIFAPESPVDPSEMSEPDPTLRVPSGSPSKILDFAKGLSKRMINSNDPAAHHEDAIKTQRAMIRATDKILGQEVDEKIQREAVGMKLVATIKLALLQKADAAKFEASSDEAIAEVTRLRQDSRTAVAQTADEYWVAARALKIKTMSAEERAALVDELCSGLNSQFTQQKFGEAYFLFEQLSQIEDFSQATSLLERVAEIASRQDVKEVRAMAPRLIAQSKLLRLHGNPIEIEGQLSDGRELDWGSYRGKVVLIDFWATWCGPCLEELKNIKANYEKYHSKGFDIVAISIDRDQKAWADFVKAEKLPWAQVLDYRETDPSDLRQSMSKKFGISGIPQPILVDQKGIVVSLEARGEELGRLLEKMLASNQ